MKKYVISSRNPSLSFAKSFYKLPNFLGFTKVREIYKLNIYYTNI